MARPDRGSDTHPRPGARTWPLYVGGFLGPFGGAVTNTMLPELARGIGSDLPTAASAVTWYMGPFCLALLVSGTMAARWGRGRTIRTAYVVYVLASIVCIVAQFFPDPAVVAIFMGGRAVQGIANAFATPVLVALLGEFIAAHRIGGALGIFASMQAAGQAFAPLVGGIAADLDYRLAFVVTGVAALVLALVTPTGKQGTPGHSPNWRALANVRVLQSSLVAFAAQVTATGITVLAALVATDRFDLSPTARGAVVAIFGVTGLLSGTLSGRLADRFGVRAFGVVALLVLGASMALVGVATHLVVLVVLVGLIGTAGTAGRVLSNTLALRSTPENTGGATSVTMAVQFAGAAMVPAVLPLYQVSPVLACVVVGTITTLGAVVAAIPTPPAATGRPEGTADAGGAG